MKALKFIMVMSAAAVVIAACTDVSPEGRIKKARSMTQKGTPFYNELSKDYMDLAVFEVGQNDRRSAADYAKRSIIAGSGKTILPEGIYKRKLPANTVSELTNARSQLLSALDSGGRKNHPAVAALAQAKFDCWMEQQEENQQPDHIAACKLQWKEAMAKLGVDVKTAPKTTKVFIIYFDFDKSNITSAANAILDEVILAKKSLSPKRILLSGHTDSAGPSSYNNGLSKRRVNAAIKALAKRNVAASAMKAEHYGEKHLKVPTGDGVKEPGNRRVEIYFLK